MHRETSAAFGSFAAFGAVWGVWGAAVPRIQTRAGVSDGKLGLALLCIGAGALPAMFVAGRLIDRFGLQVVGELVAALGVLAAGLAGFATDMTRLCTGLAMLGALSGSADVGINTIAGRAEAITERRVIARSHGIFSAAVVVSSLVSGAVFALGASVAVPFLGAAVVCLLAGGWTAVQVRHSAGGSRPGRPDAVAGPARLPHRETVSLILLGLLGALAFATENAHQSWSAVYAHNQLHASTGLAAVAPAVFAAAVSASRLTLSAGRTRHEGVVLVWGAAFAAAGAVVVAAAPDLAVDGIGLVLAAVGTAVLFPTLLGLVSRTLPESHRGRGTSLVSGVSYAGFLLGPAYVGGFASVGGLRVAMFAVGALPVVLALCVQPVLRTGRLSPGPGTVGASAS
jgi:MFS family permease